MPCVHRFIDQFSDIYLTPWMYWNLIIIFRYADGRPIWSTTPAKHGFLNAKKRTNVAGQAIWNISAVFYDCSPRWLDWTWVSDCVALALELSGEEKLCKFKGCAIDADGILVLPNPSLQSCERRGKHVRLKDQFLKLHWRATSPITTKHSPSYFASVDSFSHGCWF